MLAEDNPKSLTAGTDRHDISGLIDGTKAALTFYWRLGTGIALSPNYAQNI